jgi:hypothetical protein
MRAIAVCFDSDLILLLAITLDHDHERMKRLIRQSASDISDAGLSFLEGSEPEPL